MFLVIVLAIAAISLGAATLPLYLPINIKFVSPFAGGIILAAAFLLVIPEGMKAVLPAGNAGGLPLFAGYMFMYLIDSYFSLQRKDPEIVDMADLRMSGAAQPRGPEPVRKALKFGGLGARFKVLDNMSLTTLGMLIHSAADGISLGAAYSSDSISLKFTILASLLLHKAPAAFSLTTVLQKQGITPTALKRDIVLFSLACPVGALTTYYALQNAGNYTTAVGNILLFSGGTFAFVAVDVQTEVTSIEQIGLTLLGSAVPLIASFFPDD